MPYPFIEIHVVMATLGCESTFSSVHLMKIDYFLSILTHYVCKLHAKYVNEFIIKLHCFIVLSWQGITNEVTAFQKCVVFSNFPFFSTVLLHKSEGCESKIKGCESISRYGTAQQ